MKFSNRNFGEIIPHPCYRLSGDLKKSFPPGKGEREILHLSENKQQQLAVKGKNENMMI